MSIRQRLRETIIVEFMRGSTGNPQCAIGTKLRIASHGINLGVRIEMNASILLEIDEGVISTYNTMSSGQEGVWIKQGATAAPQEHIVFIEECDESYKGMVEILHPVASDRRNRTDG